MLINKITFRRAFVAFSTFLLLASALATAATPEALDSQVRKYWAAELAKDYSAVYDLMSDTLKRETTREEYIKLRREIGPWTYVTADVKEAEVEGEIAWVNVKFDYKLTKYPTVGGSLERWQQWRRTDVWHPVPPAEAEQWPVLPPKLRPLAEEARVKQLVAAQWAAMSRQDWKTFYGYTSPAFRGAVPI